MSKLIVCTGTLMAGGAERVLSLLSTSFADRFEEVHYLMWLDSNGSDIFYEIDPRVRVIGLTKACGSSSRLRHVLWFRKYVKQEKPDVVLSFMAMINFAVIISLLGVKTKIVVSERNDPRFFHRGVILRKFLTGLYYLPCVKNVVVQTKNNKDYFGKRLSKKIEIIYNPILMNSEYRSAAIGHVKKNLIVNVARLEPQKNQSMLISAFARFHNSFPEYKLVIYGEGSLRQFLEKEISKNGLQGVVSLPGISSNIWDNMLYAKAFVLPSIYEGMSNSLLEAMILGLPCISTKVSGSVDVIINDYNGILINQDKKELADALSELINDKAKMDYLSRNATAIFKEVNIENIQIKWINILK